MFDQQEHVVLDLAGNARASHLALERECLRVRLQAKVGDEELAH
jgi:hypothetical protein